MADLQSLAEVHKDLPEDAQKKAGESLGGSMPEEHNAFVTKIVSLMDAGEIDLHDPDSFLNQEMCKNLRPEQKSEIALALVNLADEIRHIYEFFRNKKTPNESPELKSMIEHAWQKTKKIEDSCGDVFKF